MQVKAIVKYYYTIIRMTKIKKNSVDIKYWKKLDHSYIAVGFIKWFN